MNPLKYDFLDRRKFVYSDHSHEHLNISGLLGVEIFLLDWWL